MYIGGNRYHRVLRRKADVNEVLSQFFHIGISNAFFQLAKH